MIEERRIFISRSAVDVARCQGVGKNDLKICLAFDFVAKDFFL